MIRFLMYESHEQTLSRGAAQTPACLRNLPRCCFVASMQEAASTKKRKISKDFGFKCSVCLKPCENAHSFACHLGASERTWPHTCAHLNAECLVEDKAADREAAFQKRTGEACYEADVQVLYRSSTTLTESYGMLLVLNVRTLCVYRPISWTSMLSCGTARCSRTQLCKPTSKKIL